MAEGGFEVVDKSTKKEEGSRPVTANRPGRGGRGRGGDKPRGGARIAANNEAAGNDVREQRERQPYRGKPRQENHPYDR